MVEEMISKFKSYLPCAWEPRPEQVQTLERLAQYAQANGFCADTGYDGVFIEAVNQKLGLNSVAYRQLLDEAFCEKIKLNYILKTKIKQLLDSGDEEGYTALLEANHIATEGMKKAFKPAGNRAMDAVAEIYRNDSKYADIYCSIFSRFCFRLFPEECTFRFFSEEDDITEDYFSFLSAKYPDMVKRDDALYILDISKEMFSDGYEQGCALVLNAVRDAFKRLDNHCDMAVYIPPLAGAEMDMQWRLFSDVILFAEKHNKETIDRTYFKWQKIGTQTLEYIRNITAFDAEFAFAFQGFVFKDCFVLGGEDPYSLLLIFEKNVRDERVVNCPACRSKNVQGNSYPILNVRSWECRNPLCPDRSKYDRGKRYAFMSLFRQREMMDDENVIPDASIANWRLDCQRDATKEDAFDMAILHYSCKGDGVVFISAAEVEGDRFGRKVRWEPFVQPKINWLAALKGSAYFYRYLQHNDRESRPTQKWTMGKASVFCGDALDVLRTLPEESISCAVTSPPYYNAKSYSQWPNIYCYLYDMYNINLEVFRTLKPGAIYLYNIFDYFDNENNIVLSAMGDKRMILGAYMVDIFTRIGFQVRGNIIWNKGEVQGNRNFNQGNLTPYYQAPLNCWEHILILSKGTPDKKYEHLHSGICDIKPVVKMIRGKNVLGHEAPYPIEIPELLIDCMCDDDVVLDPFLGSGTTCIAANRQGKYSVGVEISEKFFELCKHQIESDQRSSDLSKAV